MNFSKEMKYLASIVSERGILYSAYCVCSLKGTSHFTIVPYYMLQVAMEVWGARAIIVAVFVVPDLTRILDHSVVVVPNRTRILDQPEVSSPSTEIFRRQDHYMTT